MSFSRAVSLCLIAVIFSAGYVSGAAADDSDQASATEPRRFVEIHDDIRVFLKREATAENDQQRMAAIRDICEVFVELKHDPRLATQPVLRGYKNQLWTRLDKLKREFKRYVRADEKAQRRSKSQRKSKSSDDEKNEIDENEIEEEVAKAISSLNRQLSDQMSLVSYSSGGPVGVVQQSSRSWNNNSIGGAGGGAIRANATQLIEVIQTAIAPDSWDINGGEGTIFFYAPLNALVVRSTSEVHENVGGIIGALRRAGR